MNEKKAKKLLNKVKDTYKEIAEEFSATRIKHGNEFELFLPYIKENSIIIDIGCGNGRVLGYLNKQNLPTFNYLGIDNNTKFIDICNKKYPRGNFIEGDMLNLPLKENFADLSLYIRSFHHIPTKKLRQQSIIEAHRTLKQGGTIMISVWNLWQKKNFSTLIKSILRSIFTLGIYQYNDVFIKWGKKQKRYYHAFTMKEFEKLFNKDNFKIIHKEKGKDLIIIATKI